MRVYEALSLMIAFGILVATITWLVSNITEKKKTDI